MTLVSKPQQSYLVHLNSAKCEYNQSLSGISDKSWHDWIIKCQTESEINDSGRQEVKTGGEGVSPANEWMNAM